MSRLLRHQERILLTRLTVAILGSIGLIVLVSLFGLKALIQFSIFVDTIRGTPKQTQTAPSYISPPTLEWLPQATSSAEIQLRGSGGEGLSAVIYINDNEMKKLTISTDGSFVIPDLAIADGKNDIRAKLIDDLGNTSDYSNTVTVTRVSKEPKLEILSPQADAKITGDTNTITVSGKTDPSNTVSINGRIVVILPDGSFSQSQTLSEGDNTIIIVAVDEAGIETKAERKIRYER